MVSVDRPSRDTIPLTEVHELGLCESVKRSSLWLYVLLTKVVSKNYLVLLVKHLSICSESSSAKALYTELGIISSTESIYICTVYRYI
jgi:hypothetical protein